MIRKTVEIGILLILLGLTVSADEAEFLSPQHDVRIMMALDKPQTIVTKFHNSYYGDTIRLGEFGCGDPHFTLHINRVPTITANGWLNKDGSYGTRLSMFAGANAKIHETCFFLKHPSVGGTARMNAELQNVTGLSSIKLRGHFSLGALADILGISFPISNNVSLPETPTSIPIDLRDVNGVDLEFGQFKNGFWESACPKKHKDIPVYVNAGSSGDLGKFSHDNSPRGNAYLIFDLTVGKEPKYKKFATASEQTSDFLADSPLVPNEPERDIGISIKDSFFGQAKTNGESTGLLGALLPIRIRGQDEWIALCQKRKVSYEVVLSEASIYLDPNSPEDNPAIQVKFGSSHAVIYDVQTRKIIEILGPANLVKNVNAHAKFDRIRYDAGLKAITFNVSDFGVDIKFRAGLVKVKLSAKELQSSLNDGVIPIIKLNPSTAIELPNCLDTHYEKFKSRGDACPEFGAGKVIGVLSFEPFPPGNLIRKYTLELQVPTFRAIRKQDRIEISAGVLEVH